MRLAVGAGVRRRAREMRKKLWKFSPGDSHVARKLTYARGGDIESRLMAIHIQVVMVHDQRRLN